MAEPDHNRPAEEVFVMAVTALSAPDGVNASPFSRALEKYVSARDHLNSLPTGTTLEDDDRATAAYFMTQRDLLATPARTLADMRAKCETLWLDPDATPPHSDILIIFEDFRRLTGGGVSSIFNPEQWLAWFEQRGGMFCLRGDEVFLLLPEAADLANCMFELEASGGREAVCDLIRRRGPSEVANG